MGTRDMSVGLEVSLPAKDKAWAEAQKRDVLTNAWNLTARAQSAIEAAQGTLARGNTLLFLGLLFVGGAVVYNARQR